MNSTENIQQTKSSVYWIMYTRLNIPFSFLYSLKQYWRRSKHVRKGRVSRVRKKSTVGFKIRENLGRNIYVSKFTVNSSYYNKCYCRKQVIQFVETKPMIRPF